MKNFILALLLLCFLTYSNVSESQGPPPPPASDEPDRGHGSTFNQEPEEGGTAPISSGVFLLMGMAFAYSLYKFKTTKTNQSIP